MFSTKTNLPKALAITPQLFFDPAPHTPSPANLLKSLQYEWAQKRATLSGDPLSCLLDQDGDRLGRRRLGLYRGLVDLLLGFRCVGPDAGD